MDARGSTGGQPMLARARDCRKCACRWMGHDRDRVDARYCIADDRGAQGRWADVREPGARLAPPIRRSGGAAGEMALPIESIAINYIAISITYEFAVLF